MSSLTFWIKVARPAQCLIAGIATYVIALLSNGHDWFTASNIAASMTMFIGVMGASLFHYGAARRIYARKYWDMVEASRPWVLITLGIIIFCFSSLIAFIYLPKSCFWITIINSLGISLYARVLSKHWSTKNVVIAFICTTPVLMGWLSGNNLHPALPYFFAIAFFSYLGREIFKDINDMKANNGIRVTLPIWLGNIKRALWVAYASISCSCIFLLFLFNTFRNASILAETFYILAIIAFALIPFVAKKKGIRSLPSVVTIANSSILISAFALKIAI